MTTLKAKQDDLRRLMKERRENLRDQKNKVDSPFAKYNSLGHLFCTICNIQIKSNGLWAPHVAGKIHKENALKKKKGTADNNSISVSHVSEKTSEMQPPALKKLKLNTDESVSPKIDPPKTIVKMPLLEAYSSSEDEDEANSVPIESTSKNILNNELPKDFFDVAPASSYPINEEQAEEEKPVVVPVNSVEALPEGFFDDPVLDAKARNIEYKDPIEEEWERYQRAIAEETNVSKSIIEEDFEESILERDLTEIDLEINLWEKAKRLQTLAEEANSKAPSNKDKKDSSSSTDDELDEDDLLDWRSKGIRKK